MRIASAFPQSQTLVAITDTEDGCLVDVNDAFLRVLGWSREEVIGTTPDDLGLWKDLRDRYRTRNMVLEGGCVQNEPISFLTKTGAVHEGLISVDLLRWQGRDYVFSFVQDITLHKQQVAQIRAVEARYKALFDSAIEGIYESSLDGTLLAANPALAEMLGYRNAEEMIAAEGARGEALYLDPAARKRLIHLLQTEGEARGLEAQVRRKDGSAIWIAENAVAEADEDGNIVQMRGSVVDITPRREAEAKLRYSEEKYRVLVEHSQDGVFISSEGVYVYVNKAYADMLGYKVAQLTGKPYMDLVAPEDRPAQLERARRRREGFRDTHSFEINLIHADGSTRVPVSVRVGNVEMEELVVATGTVRDVTEERRRERELRAAEEKYRSIFQNSVTGMYRSTPDGRFIEANEALARLFGYSSSAELMRSLTHIKDLYEDPGQREILLDELNRKGLISGLEYRIRRRDGVTIWVSQDSRVIRKDDGSVDFYEGTLVDITDRKVAEESLAQSELRYRTLLTHSQVGVFINQGGHYTYVNNAFASMLGYQEEELTGLHYSALFMSDEGRGADDRYMKRMRGEDVPNNYETRLVRKDGSLIDVTVAVGVFDQDGTRMMTGTIRDITEQKKAESQLVHNATHDPLTGLPNRVLFVERLREAMQGLKHGTSPGYAVLFLDLDRFKVVNDSLGHAAGDRLLQEISIRLGACMGPGDTIARHGGDEFTILLADTRDSERATRIADRVLEAMAEPFQIDMSALFSGASIGVVIGHPGYSTTDEVLRDADIAMYQAKARGETGFVVFDQAMHEMARARLKLETDLRLAIERSEFRVHYQPIVNAADHKIEGFEALVRWQHPEEGLLGPHRFLAAAAETGLILAIDWWVMERACRDLLYWRENFPEHGALSINVNIDDRQFSDRELGAKLTSMIEATGIPTDALNLEITEKVFRDDAGRVSELLEQLEATGAKLYVDDFGTGYSSLDSLRDAPFQSLKIDRSFISGMEADERKVAIVRTIVALARDLGLGIVAEGVETTEQLELLSSLGCPLIQGFIFARPMPAADVEVLLGPEGRLETMVG